MEADAMFELATLYRDAGDLRTAAAIASRCFEVVGSWGFCRSKTTCF
jgi:hypothetical protein